MKLKLRLTVVCVVLMGLSIGGTAIAGDVELWEGEFSTQAINSKQIVAGSVTINNSNPGAVTVTQPEGDNATITITGVKEGEATITASGLLVVRNVGVNQDGGRSEKSFTAYISVVVVKPTTISKEIELFEGDTASVKFTKKKPNLLLTNVYSNSNKKVCAAKRNTQKAMTIKGLKKGKSTVTLKLKVKGKKQSAKGVVHVTVKARAPGVKKKKRKIVFNRLPDRKQPKDRAAAPAIGNSHEEVALRPAVSIEDLRSVREGWNSRDSRRSAYVPLASDRSDPGALARHDVARQLHGLAAIASERDAMDRNASNSVGESIQRNGPDRDGSERSTDTGNEPSIGADRAQAQRTLRVPVAVRENERR